VLVVRTHGKIALIRVTPLANDDDDGGDDGCNKRPHVLSIQSHLEAFFLSFAQGLAGAVDILPAAERVGVVVAAVVSFNVDVKYECDRVHQHDCSYIIVILQNDTALHQSILINLIVDTFPWSKRFF